jgi:hypothetical protein
VPSRKPRWHPHAIAALLPSRATRWFQSCPTTIGPFLDVRAETLNRASDEDAAHRRFFQDGSWASCGDCKSTAIRTVGRQDYPSHGYASERSMTLIARRSSMAWYASATSASGSSRSRTFPGSMVPFRTSGSSSGM